MINKRYKPKTQQLTIRKFGDTFFRSIDEINFKEPSTLEKDKLYPVGWDDLHDRDVVWTTTKNMVDDYIEGIGRYCDNNPICLIDLKSNVKTLDPVFQKDSIEYWNSFIEQGYEYFVFIGKNRTLTSIYKIWSSLKNGDSTYSYLDNDDYVVEFKIFDKYFDNDWKGEFYRGEKTIFPDTEIMKLVSYPCKIGTWIYKYVKDESKLSILKNIFSWESIVKYEHRELLFDLMWYHGNNTYFGSPKLREEWWSGDKEVPKGFRDVMNRVEGWIQFLNTTTTQEKGFRKSWLTSNRSKFIFMIFNSIKQLNLTVSEKGKWDDFYVELLTYISKSMASKEKYGYTDNTDLTWNKLVSGLSYSSKPYEDEDCTKPMDMYQFQLLRNIVNEQFITKCISNGILIEIEPRENFDIKKRLELFFKNGQMIRVNGLVEKDNATQVWYDSNTKDILYKKYSVVEFFQIQKDVDHIESLRTGGTNDDSNLELTTSGFNKFKSTYRLIQ